MIEKSKKNDIVVKSDSRIKVQSKPRAKRKNKLTLYIPEKIDIEIVLRDFPPTFNYHKDCFIYILHLVTSIVAERKDYDIEQNDGFTPIKREYLQNRIHGYRKYIDYLIEQGIVEENRQYKVGEKSRGLRVTEKYNSVIKPYYITKWTLIKSILFLNKGNQENNEEKYPYLKKWWNQLLKIDLNRATEYLNNEYIIDVKNPLIKYPMQRQNMRLIPVEKLYRIQHSDEFLFKVDEKVGRLHTLLTQLKSELRAYVTYNDKKLCSVDITNSQPYLLKALLDIDVFKKNKIGEKVLSYNTKLRGEHQSRISPSYNNVNVSQDLNFEYQSNMTNNDEGSKDYCTDSTYRIEELIHEIQEADDVKLFNQLVTDGTFYEEFGVILKGMDGIVTGASDSRKEAKISTFGALFSRNTSIGFKQEMKDFRDNFPNVYKMIKYVKSGKDQHPALACLLQNLESWLVLDKICGRIAKEKPDVPLFTIHDSIVSTLDNADYIKKVMEEELEKAIGNAPKLKIEIWE